MLRRKFEQGPPGISAGCAADDRGAGAHDGLLLDADHLDRQTFGDAALQRQVLEMFMAQLQNYLERLSGAAAHEQAAFLHSIKGSAASVGAARLAKRTAALEEACRKGLTPTSQEFSRLRMLCDETAAAIRRHLG